MWIRIRITDPQSCSRRIQFGSLSGSTTLVLITDQCFGFIESGSGQTSDSGSKLILNTARNWYKIISYSEDFPVKISPLKDVPVFILKLKLFCCYLTFFFLSPWIRIPNPDPEEPWIRIRNTATDCITHCCRWWGGLRRSCWRRSRWCLTTTRPQPPWEDSDYSNYYYY